MKERIIVQMNVFTFLNLDTYKGSVGSISFKCLIIIDIYILEKTK